MKLFGKRVAPLVLALFVSPSVAQTNIESKILKIKTPNEFAPGSGFIIGPDKRGKCILLTARHVIIDGNGDKLSEVPIIFPNGKTRKVPHSSFFYPEDENLDLAAGLVPCQSSLQLPLAKASAVTISTKVRVVGYPADVHAQANLPPSTVTGRITKFSAAGQDAKLKGYDLSYSAPTKVGYSGGPVLNDDLSEIIAVHGYTFSVQPKPVKKPAEAPETDDVDEDDLRERLRVGGSGISSSVIYKFLKDNGYTMPRSDKAVCLVGTC